MWLLRAGVAWCVCAAVATAEDRETWIIYLKSGSESAHEKAYKGLASEGPDAFADVAELLNLKNEEVRLRAVLVLLGYAKQMENIDRHRDVLLEALGDEDRAVALMTATVLSYAGPKTIPKLYSLGGGKDAAIAEMASVALANSGKRAVPYLARKLTSTSKRNVLRALALLARMGSEGAGARANVVPLLASPRKEFRLGAYRAMAMIEPDGAVATGILLKGLDDADLEIATVCGGLMARHSKEAAEALVPRLAEPPSVARDRALLVLSRLDERAAPVIERMLKSPDSKSRAEALRILMPRGDLERTSKFALEILGKGTPAERIAAARFLAVRSTNLDVITKTLPALIKDKERAVADWAWYRSWWRRAEPLPKRAPIDSEVLARLGVTRPGAVDDLIKRSKDPDATVALRAVEGLGLLARDYPPGTPDLRARRFAGLPKDVQASCHAAWRWLAAHQEPDGFWSAGILGCEIGVTAYALLAFSAGGHTDMEGPYAPAIRNGINALLGRMGKGGIIGSAQQRQFLVQHLMATAALTDAYLVGSCPGHRPNVLRAIDAMMLLRHHRGAWAYSPRQQNRDVYHTIWGAYAARLGTLAGLLPKERYADDVIKYIRRMTDQEFGQVGYRVAGGSPGRSSNYDLSTMLIWQESNKGGDGYDRFPPEKSQSMTAAGVWAHFLLDDARRNDKIVHAGFALIGERPPTWNPDDGSIDMVYWHFGANALALRTLDGSKSKTDPYYRRWYLPGVKTLVDNQNESGSWEPIGAWGKQGGEAYSAASGLLYLLAPIQFSPDFFASKRDHRPGAYALIFETLEKISRSKEPRRAFAATMALRE
ncbi:MAG: hypothetical protein ACYTGZ_10670 [Planctomycetota bacterium]|jgi:hypothetical protein